MQARIVLGWLLAFMPAMAVLNGSGQTAYFADGFHGGIYGHYPATFTQFMVDGLRSHPDWKINLEIEPETWDFACTNTPEAYSAFKQLVEDQSQGGRVEFVNPAYGQSYLWNISGESVIQQFDRGRRKIHQHFPNAKFTTYSSEEPCFTSALPGILESFGFKYAVLKNPNTCWGGYMRGFGGELINWVGPDGTMIPTVPRYACEALKLNSTWETIGNANSSNYIKETTLNHILNPVGMCLQDAGWRFGPWLDHVGDYYHPTQYTLWRDYFGGFAMDENRQEWRLSQEDVQVSLVWGAQVLQRIAQQVHHAENSVVRAEKMATLGRVFRDSPWPDSTLDEAWRTLLLSQHHDCWIVPYNRRGSNTWAEKVAAWTETTCAASEAVVDGETSKLVQDQTNGAYHYIRVFNTLGEACTGITEVRLPVGWSDKQVRISNRTGEEVPLQCITDSSDGSEKILFHAQVPAMGFNTYRLEQAPASPQPKAASIEETNGLVVMELDQYRMVLDSKRGGTVRSLIDRKWEGHELIDASSERRFNEVRGYFFKQKKFFSNADGVAKIDVLENGPVRLRVRIRSEIASNAVEQIIELVSGEPRIDCSVRIDWKGNPGIGEDFGQSEPFRREDDHKAFYDDRYKLLLLFPLNISHQQIFKDAPFDVVESRLTNTFFNDWSAIKNNVMLNWVEVYGRTQDAGMALFTDHTTSYAHGGDYPLALTLQYSGIGLWGRNYSLEGATEVHYALLPHRRNWEKADVWSQNKMWNEPLTARVFSAVTDQVEWSRSLFTVADGGWEVPTMRVRDGKVFVRLFNPLTQAAHKSIRYTGPVSNVEMVKLDGQSEREIEFHNKGVKGTDFTVSLPPFGIGTLCITP